MPKCEITGIEQMMTKKCLHPKHEGKYVGYLTCKSGLKSKNGVLVCVGGCPHFIEGSGTNDEWCKLRKEKRENDRIDSKTKKQSGER